MRTTEAARYARWSVTVAAMLAVMVGVVYVLRLWQARQAEGAAPPPVPPAVQQRSAKFSFSKVDGNRTQFVVRASHATEFKDGGRTLLEDVWITTYGNDGKGADQLRTASCDYFAESGGVTCPDEVMIDLQDTDAPGSASVQDAAAAAAPSAVHVVTSHLTFNRQTGVAAGEEPVQFHFAQGEGRAIGLNYDSQRGELHLLHDVELVFRSPAQGAPPAAQPSTGEPMTISSGELLYRRDERLIHLNGSATMRQGRQELQAGQMTLEMDEEMRGRRLVARDHPVLHNPNGGTDVSLSADELAAPLSTGGRPERVIATGNVVLDAVGSQGRNHLTAASSNLELVPDSQQPRHFTADGNVAVQSILADGSTRHLQTSHLEVYFADSNQGDSHIDRATASAGIIEWQDSSRNSSRGETEDMRLTGQLLDGSFGETGELRELRGSGGVTVVSRVAGGVPMTSTSRELLAKIEPDGAWSSVDQTGDVRLKSANGDAQGDRAHFDRIADTVTLTGSVVITDASSQTRAQSATFRQNANELDAQGKVVTTELLPSTGGSADPGSEPSHVSADRLVADTATGRAVYSGKARLWQGDSVIQADTIDLSRATRTLIATGNVRAVFPQAGQAPVPVRVVSGPPAPRFWRAEASQMTYEENQHRAWLEQNARVVSADGSLRADRIDLLFVQPNPSQPRPISSKSGVGTGLGASFGGQQLQRAQGVGAARVEKEGRVGTSERADYWAPENKFVLSGGRPTLADQSGNSTTGRQLTFYLADDKIVVDSEEGSRTLTLHRVEK
jgi:lipopolysaccharide transport protein LptA